MAKVILVAHDQTLSENIGQHLMAHLTQEHPTERDFVFVGSSLEGCLARTLELRPDRIIVVALNHEHLKACLVLQTLSDNAIAKRVPFTVLIEFQRRARGEPLEEVETRTVMTDLDCLPSSKVN